MIITIKMENIWYIKDAACFRCYMIAISMSINIYQFQLKMDFETWFCFQHPFQIFYFGFDLYEYHHI